MGTAKTKYQRKDEQQFSSYFLLGMIIIVFVMVVSYFLYNTLSSEITYSDFDHISQFEEIPNQDEMTYYVYYYSKDFSLCVLLEDDMLIYAGDASNQKLYFASASSIKSINIISGLSSAPTLLEINNGVVISMTSDIEVIQSIITITN